MDWRIVLTIIFLLLASLYLVFGSLHALGLVQSFNNPRLNRRKGISYILFAISFFGQLILINFDNTWQEKVVVSITSALAVIIGGLLVLKTARDLRNSKL